MALIRQITLGKMSRYQTHSEIDAVYYLHETEGKKLFQLNTAGKSDREFPDKTSQSIQLDEESAHQLFLILKDHFGFE